MSTELNPFGYIENGKVFLKPFLSYETRELGDVKGSDEESIAYFMNRFELFENKVKEIQELIAQSDNKGSYLMKILHLKDQVGLYNGLGDYSAILHTLGLLENQIQQLVEENRRKNLEIKKVILEELNVLANDPNWSENLSKAKDIQQRWIRIGKVTEEKENEYEESFKAAVNTFFENYKEHLAAKNELFTIRKEQYTKLLNEAKELLKGNISKASIERFKAIQVEWKEIGQIPKNILGETWLEFKEVSNNFFENVKTQRKRSKKPSSNIDELIKAKTEIGTEAQKLYSDDPYTIGEKSKALKKAWKDAGNVPYNKIKDVQQRFYDACNYADEFSFLIFKTTQFHKDFLSKEENERKKILVSFLRKMISKENGEMDRYEDNSMNILVAEGSSFNKLLNTTLEAKKRKLNAKKKILQTLLQ